MDGTRQLIKAKLKLFLATKKDAELNAILTPQIQDELAEALMDGTACAILDSLKNLQEIKESELIEERERLVEEIAQRHGHPEEIKAFDMEILQQIDELVKEQQNHLVHVPLMTETTDVKEIRIQMLLIEFITSLAPFLAK